MASKMGLFAVAAVVREALFEMPKTGSQVAIDGKRRQIMAHAFPYIDVAKKTEKEILDQLRADIKATLDKID
jgi:hypothetical protein